MADTELDTEVKLHLQEADVLKKQWVEYVYKTIDDLSTKLDNTTEKLHKEREYLLTSLMSLKESLQREIKIGDENTLNELKELEGSVTSFISAVKEKFSKVNFNITDEVKAVNNSLIVTKTTLAEIKTKVGIYSAITSLIITVLTTAAASGLVMIFKESIKKWLWG